MSKALFLKFSTLSWAMFHVMPSWACEVEGQWASKLVAASSEYNDKYWTAKQVIGPCNVERYDDSPNAWSPRSADNSELEWIEVEFPSQEYSSGVIIRESFNPGSIRKIEIRIQDGTYLTVWEGNSYPFTPNQVNDSRFSWLAGGDLTYAVKVSIDTRHVKNDWESIDSIQLLGPPTL